MRDNNSAIVAGSPALPTAAARPVPDIPPSQRAGSAGILFGFLGVLAFSFTLPLTRIAVTELDAVFVGAGRAVVAAALAIIVLAVTRQRRPHGRQWIRLVVVGGGVIAGFPLLTSAAMQTVPAAHGAVVIGLLPAATAVAAVIRARERPSRAFWFASAAGVAAVLGFVVVSGGGLISLHPADLLLVAAVACAAIGYAEGALLSRELGSWQTICWALVVALPVMLPLTLTSIGGGVPEASAAAWLSFGYLGFISMFLGFFSWYRGLAIGPISVVSQIQLVQPVFTLAWSALIVGEQLGLKVWVGAAVVLLCAFTAVRTRVRSTAPAAGSREESASPPAV